MDFTTLVLLVFQFCSLNLVSGGVHNPLSGKHLTVLAIHDPPLIIIENDPQNTTQIQYSGFDVDVLNILAEKLNFTYSFVTISEPEWKKNGFGESLINHLKIQNADIIGNLLLPSEERTKYMDFTIAVGTEYLTILQPMPKVESRLFAAIRIFQPTVWLVLFLALILLTFLLTLLHKTKTNTNQSKLHFFVANFMYTLNILTSQGIHLPSSKLALRIMNGVFFMMSIVIVYAYNGKLVSFLSVPKYEQVVNSMEDLANSQSLSIMLPKTSVYAHNVMNASSGTYRRLGDSLRENPNHLYAGNENMFQILHSGCCGLPIGMSGGVFYTQLSMAESGGECRLTLGKELDNPVHYMFALAKGSPYTAHLNEKLQEMWENGILPFLKQKHIPTYHVGQCIDRKIRRSNQTPLSLYDVSSTFVVLGLGVSFAIFYFLLELAMNSKICRVAAIRKI